MADEPSSPSTSNSVWAYRAEYDPSADVVGYDVEAADGNIGKIDAASNQTGRNYVVVDTGFWIFGKKRLIPAGVIERVDLNGRTVHVSMTKDQIKEAPDYDDVTSENYGDDYYDRVGGHYGGSGR